jgi:hypothetical protein
MTDEVTIEGDRFRIVGIPARDAAIARYICQVRV